MLLTGQQRTAVVSLSSSGYDADVTAETKDGFDQEFGRRVAAARKQVELSQRALAELLGKRGISIDSAAVSRIENGQRSARLEEAVGIAEVLSLPITELMPARREAEQMARARQSALKYLDDALYKLTSAAGSLEYFAVLVERDPEMARKVFRDERPYQSYDWEGWASWAVESLASSPYRRVISSNDERAHGIKRVLSELARSVVVSPIDYQRDATLPGLVAEGGSDGIDPEAQ